MKLRLLALALVFACTPADEEETATTDPDTGSDPDTSAATTNPDPMLGCAVPEEQDTTDGMSNPLQETWGAACTTNADCVALIGEGAICEIEAVIYELPGGYCTKPCVLPDDATRVVLDDPMCDPAGGIACTGVKGVFENCAPLCSDDAQCNRDGYTCRQMPMIAMEGDPSLCLMPDCCLETCAEVE